MAFVCVCVSFVYKKKLNFGQTFVLLKDSIKFEKKKGMNPKNRSNQFLDIYDNHKLWFHLIFWAVYLLVITVLSATFYNRASFIEILSQLSISLWVDVAATYLTAYYLVPQFLLKKKYFLFSSLLIISVVFFVFMQRIMQVYVSVPIFYPEYDGMETFFHFNPAYSIVNIYAVVGIVTSARLFKYWFINQNKTYLLENEKLGAELKYLKSQVHPHFLFNTLNNLYALTLDKSDLAPHVVIRLSDLLSYMLYDANAEMVPLQKEISLIENYLELEHLRRGEELSIKFEKSIDSQSILIAPLLFIPFIENSFKHGVWNNIDNPMVNILLTLSDNQLYFMIRNTIGPETINQEHTDNAGIGLHNVQRRLEILYPDAHELIIEKDEKWFTIKLSINLMNSNDEGKVFIGR